MPVNIIASQNTPISGVADIGQNKKAATPTTSFTDYLKGALESTDQAAKTAEKLTLAVANGEDVPMHQVTQAVAQAEIKLQTLMTVRDKAVAAYQQLMQMPI